MVGQGKLGLLLERKIHATTFLLWPKKKQSERGGGALNSSSWGNYVKKYNDMF